MIIECYGVSRSLTHLYKILTILTLQIPAHSRLLCIGVLNCFQCLNISLRSHIHLLISYIHAVLIFRKPVIVFCHIAFVSSPRTWIIHTRAQEKKCLHVFTIVCLFLLSIHTYGISLASNDKVYCNKEFNLKQVKNKGYHRAVIKETYAIQRKWFKTYSVTLFSYSDNRKLSCTQ